MNHFYGSFEAIFEAWQLNVIAQKKNNQPAYFLLCLNVRKSYRFGTTSKR